MTRAEQVLACVGLACGVTGTVLTRKKGREMLGIMLVVVALVVGFALVVGVPL